MTDEYELLPHEELEYLRHEVEKLRKDPFGDHKQGSNLFRELQKLNENFKALFELLEASNEEMLKYYQDHNPAEKLEQIADQNTKIAKAVLTLAQMHKAQEAPPEKAPAPSLIPQSTPVPPSSPIPSSLPAPSQGLPPVAPQAPGMDDLPPLGSESSAPFPPGQGPPPFPPRSQAPPPPSMGNVPGSIPPPGPGSMIQPNFPPPPNENISPSPPPPPPPKKGGFRPLTK